MFTLLSLESGGLFRLGFISENRGFFPRNTQALESIFSLLQADHFLHFPGTAEPEITSRRELRRTSVEPSKHVNFFLIRARNQEIEALTQYPVRQGPMFLRIVSENSTVDCIFNIFIERLNSRTDRSAVRKETEKVVQL